MSTNEREINTPATRIIESSIQEVPTSAPIKLPAINPTELAERRESVKQIMQYHMKPEVHFGTKGGGYNNTKPALYKAGAEMLANTFQLGVNPRVEVLRDDMEVHYRVTCELVHLPTGKIVGRGIGECSSLEEKYAWRRATGPGEFDYFPPERRRLKWKYSYDNDQEYQERQVRVEAQDKANTILKMAKKRAFVDAIQTTLGVSDMFEEPDADAYTGSRARQRKKSRDSPPPPPDRSDERPPVDMSGTVSEGMLKTLQRHLSAAGMDTAGDFLKEFAINNPKELPATKINEALEWIKNRTKGDAQ